jgi:hypothetical protein
MASIYLLATNTKKPVSHIITAITGERFNHASISFDPGLAECYSFNMGKDGFVRETKEEWPSWTEFELYEVEVEPAGLASARKFVTEMSKSGFRFSYRGTIGIALGMPIQSDEARFCSEFVEQACVIAGLRRAFTVPAMATPQGVCKRRRAKLVASGRLHDYLVTKIGSVKQRAIAEATDDEVALGL